MHKCVNEQKKTIVRTSYINNTLYVIVVYMYISRNIYNIFHKTKNANKYLLCYIL